MSQISAYTAAKPRLPRPIEELRASVEGWGVDLEPTSRPAYPKLKFDPASTGAHWDSPERQPELEPRERSTEHRFLTPVFGTSVPLRGLSGVIRRYAYTISEGPLRHWLLLMLADRVDVLESRGEALAQGRPDNPLTESGIAAEWKRHGLSSRVGRGRADLAHQPVDILVMAAPWIIGFGLVVLGARRLRS
jgi:hypothetical protein